MNNVGTLVIGVNDIPEYIVEKPGIYRIHSLVFLPFDMDLESLVPLTSLLDLLPLLVQGGGTICASLDIEGALFEVETCTDACPAFTTSPEPLEIPCLEDVPIELPIEFNPIDAIIPDGFIQVFLLTKGPELIIFGAQTEFFLVDEPGEYRVHSLIFDPGTLDMGAIELGVTTAFDLFALFIEGGGDLCASLDLNGALFTIEG